MVEAGQIACPKHLSRRSIIAACLGLLLAACSGEEQAQPNGRLLDDPAIAAALHEPIMIDPDLATLNEANSALTTAARSGVVPAHIRSSQVADLARAEAEQLLRKGGGIERAPNPTASDEENGFATAITLQGKLLAAMDDAANCEGPFTYTAKWAANMPKAFPVYPMASVVDAAGSDSQKCNLRAAGFVSPVNQTDILNFYYSLAKHNGFDANVLSFDSDTVLTASNSTDQLVLRVSPTEWGGSQVELFTLSR